MRHSRAMIQYNRTRPLTSMQWEAVQLFLGVDADGVPGPHTGEAIATWQRQNGLEADGMFGPSTLAAMVTAGLDIMLEPRQVPDLERWRHSKVVELDSALGYLGGTAIDCGRRGAARQPRGRGRGRARPRARGARSIVRKNRQAGVTFWRSGPTSEHYGQSHR
jgi:hypothetical protein